MTSGLSNLLEWLQSLRKHLTLTSFSEDTLKGTDDQPDEETGGAKSGSIPNTGAPVPVKLECVIPPADVCSLILKLFNPKTYWDFT